MLFSVSSQDLPKDSTTMIELIGHALTLLQGRGVNLRASSIVCAVWQHTARAEKQSCLQVSGRFSCKWHCCPISILFAENWTQPWGYWSMLWPTRKAFGHESQDRDFKAAIEHWMGNSLHRPHEPQRHCVYLDQCRNWLLGHLWSRFYLLFCVIRRIPALNSHWDWVRQ